VAEFYYPWQIMAFGRERIKAGCAAWSPMEDGMQYCHQWRHANLARSSEISHHPFAPLFHIRPEI
jgi:hypothetical protein